MRFLRHDGIYRSDVSSLLVSSGQGAASRWSGPTQAIGRAGRSTPFPSSAMSSGRLFLDRVGRHQSPSPLHRHPQHNSLAFPHASIYHRTVGSVLTVCLSRGDKRILALRWADIEWSAVRLWVWRSVEETKAGVRIKETKSTRGRRPITLPQLAIEALRAQQRQQDAIKEALGPDYQDAGLICPADDGTLWKPSAFTSSYRSLLKRRKLNGPNFHALRHSHASQLLRSGADIKVVSARLGHSKSGFTLETYGHLLPGQDQDAAQRVDAALRPAIERLGRHVV